MAKKAKALVLLDTHVEGVAYAGGTVLLVSAELKKIYDSLDFNEAAVKHAESEGAKVLEHSQEKG